MDEQFNKAWKVVKNDDLLPTWLQIWEAGLANEGGDGSFLVKLIQRLDNMGHSYSAERKAVDLMINSGWSVEDTKARMYRTSQGTRPDTAIEYFINELPPGEVMMDERGDKPDEVGQGWRVSDFGGRRDLYE
tara:strand:+ start:855 stop:1250 length:396 start_codon:yes stop_codon:yes gene_type:complete